MKIITNPQYNCILKNCPDCLEEAKEKYVLELCIFFGILILGGLFYAWKVHQLNQKKKIRKKHETERHTKRQ